MGTTSSTSGSNRLFRGRSLHLTRENDHPRDSYEKRSKTTLETSTHNDFHTNQHHNYQPIAKDDPEMEYSNSINTNQCDRSNEASSSRLSIRDFEMIRVLGRGSLGMVTLVRKKSDQKLYAMKALSKEYLVQQNLVEKALSERDVMGGTCHPFLVQLHWAFQTKQRLIFVMEYCPGGELSYHLQRRGTLNENEAKFYAAEILIGLQHLHRHGIIYRDLKPENIMLSVSGHVKLVDFGLAKWGVTSSTSGTRSLCGSLEYLAPEVYEQSEYGTAADWWSFGAVLYEMLTGLPPWYHREETNMYRRMQSFPLKIPKYLSREAASLLRKLLNLSPASRLGSRRGGIEIQHHDFFQDIDWDEIANGEGNPPIKPCATEEAINDSHNFDTEFTRLSIPSADGSEGSGQHHEEFVGFSFEARSPRALSPRRPSLSSRKVPFSSGRRTKAA